MKRNPQYKQINFKSFPINNEYFSKDEKDEKCLRNLSQINMFIGPNNSGKSRFLRTLYDQLNYMYWPSNIPMGMISSAADQMHATIQRTLQHDQSLNNISRNTFLVWATSEFISSGRDNSYSSFVSLLEGIVAKTSISNHSSSIFDPSTRWQQIRNEAELQLIRLKQYEDNLGSEARIYIPILRGLRPLAPSDVNFERTQKDYSFQITNAKTIFTGHSLYRELQKLRDGDVESRRLAERYEAFLSKEFFDGQAVEVVPRVDQDSVYVRIGETNDLPIYSLGDGIQSLIILTFLAFISKERTLFFIEEPDLYMHPGMQRKFIELLVRHESFAPHQFFFTTHSNHFLDMTIDYPCISTFLFKKRNGKIEIQNTSNIDKNILHEIGVRSSSVFLTNVSIWVEGITDRLYLRECLNKYMQANSLRVFREDTHFSLIEYGGGNLVHFNFSEVAEDISDRINLSRVCGECILIMDGDSANKSSRLNMYREQLGENVITFNSKEIENILPDTLISNAVKNLLERSTLSREDLPLEKISAIKQE